MLEDPRTERVTGDHTAGIHRRADDVDAEQHPEKYREEPVPEAYCWSGLTSGNGSRALWLLLLPFMVVNIAHWMRPSVEVPARSRAVRVHGLLVRLVALSLTVLLVAAACEVALDLAAWQCAGSELCAARRDWLGFLAPEDGNWWGQPGRRLALAALVPTALTGLLWWLSHRTWSAYESQPPPAHEAVTENDPEAGARPALCLPGFWYGRRLVARLRAAHTAAGFLTVAAALAAAATRHDRKPGGSPWLDAAGWAVEVALVAAGAFVVWVVCARGRSESAPDDRLDRAVVRFLPGAALALLALTALHAAWSRPGWTSGGLLPGDEAFGVIALAQGALVIALAVVGRRMHRAAPDPRAALRGYRGAAVAMLACALGGVMSGGVAQRVADWLDGPGTPGMDDGWITGPPVVLSWQAAVIPVMLFALVVLAAYFAGQTWRVRREEIRKVRASHPGEPEDSSRTGRIAGTTARARLTDCAPWFVGVTALFTVLLGGAAVAGAWLSSEVPGRAADGTTGVVEALATTTQAVGSWLMGLGFILFIAGGRRAYKDASARRTIGILWDVGTFWPRAAHPFAPPCYAERAVPDLSWRMDTWTRLTGGRLVISGHSQGSVLAAAAVWQLDPGTRRRVALLTYGSPLERLYGRWFPAYFGPGPLHALHSEIHCWRNLWRETDPIGGPVLLPGAACDAEAHEHDVDRGPLRDPLEYGRTLLHPLPAPILGHSEYQADPVFAEERAGLLERLPEVPRQRATARLGGARPPGAGTAAAGSAGPGTAGRPGPPGGPADQESSGRSSG
ncbi:hypothetical protein GCU69_08795 [Streptomyces lycii]|uniref:Integral membrane protein n=2 Tax=Streptomyces lycii TaxID=2654337 RepID=A0ABQ7FKJ0_9ACTN|nr:hypothetical protein [Streptomyces lycii]KAF4409481.1 hypothetical protein GCU69_08795 [Streptomyces lycii]